MNSFIGQDGTIKFHYRTYGVEEVAPFSPEPRIRPNSPLNLIAPGAKGPEQHRGNFGMGTGRFDWNARDDRLATSPLWRGLWTHPGSHVVVPASRVYEATTRFGARRWFAVKRVDEVPLWLAGLGRIQKGAHRVEWHVTLVTVDSGPVFREIHDTPREVVCLRNWEEAAQWMNPPDAEPARALLRPGTRDVIESYRVHDDVLRDSFPAERCAEPFAEAPQRTL